MKRRKDVLRPAGRLDEEFRVMRLSQTGEITAREAGKGNNPARWLGTYFENSSGRWYAAKAGDVVYSGIDLWKGCIGVVPETFDGELVTQEFPIYRVTDSRLDPEFLQCLLKTRYYQRAFRAITTGHSNRRRTQSTDFKQLQVTFPEDKDEQAALIAGLKIAKGQLRAALDCTKIELNNLSNLIDGRGQEELPELVADDGDDE